MSTERETIAELSHDELVDQVIALRRAVEEINKRAGELDAAGDHLVGNLVLIAAELGAPSPASYDGVMARVRALRALEKLADDLQSDLGEALNALALAKIKRAQ